MNAFLLYHPKTRITGRALAKLLGIPSGIRCGKQYEKISHIIRWGSGADVAATFTDGAKHMPRIEFNKRHALSMAGSKYRATLVMGKAGVNVPPTQKDFPSLEQFGENERQWLGRRFHHARGTDIVRWYYDIGAAEMIADGEDGNSDYYVQYIKPHKEWRIHVMCGDVILAQKKYFREELFDRIVADECYDGDITHKHYCDTWEHSDAAIKLIAESQIIRNNDHGWGFHNMNDIANVPSDVIVQALRAVKAIGLDFGAVDVISTDEKYQDGTRKAYVLEINTAPGLRDKNLQLYADRLSNILAP